MFEQHPMVRFFQVEYGKEYNDAVSNGVTVTPDFVRQKLGLSKPSLQKDYWERLKTFLKVRLDRFEKVRTLSSLEWALKSGYWGPTEKRELSYFLRQAKDRYMTVE